MLALFTMENVGQMFVALTQVARDHGANVQGWSPNGDQVEFELRGAFVGVLSVLQRIEVAGEPTRVKSLAVTVKGARSASVVIEATCRAFVAADPTTVPETNVAKRFEALAKAIPSKAWLTSYHDEVAAIRGAGKAIDLDDVSAFMGALQKSQHFTDVTLDRATREGQIVTFSFKASPT